MMNDKLKELIRKKFTEYLDRAEKLKEHIAKSEEKRSKAKVSATGASAGSTAGGPNVKGDDGDDPEIKKMRQGLQGAILSESPNVKWEDVAGLAQAKEALKEAVILPIKFPQLFTGKRTPWRGILLYGPPGTGARGEGESEASRRIKTEFLVQMNGVGNEETGVLVLGATNIPWQLDPAIKRRFEKRIYIPLPDIQARRRMFEINIGSTPHGLTPADFTHLAEQTDGYSGSDIAVIVRDALMQPVRKVLSATHFKEVNKLLFFPFFYQLRILMCIRTQVEVDTPEGPQIKLTPCSPGAPSAIEKTWTDIESSELLEPLLGLKDFEKAITVNRPTVSTKDIEKHIQFTNESGGEGA
ncbi:vacuolar protein-sorting-associated protein 4 [Cryptococcus deuterogattii 2001/935-1]|nr:vacuolar protein-sorting-associated protein 4 [Cryptococcus deuterogattii 2001/935-1]